MLQLILNLLNHLLRKDAKWKWTKECQDSFELAKEWLVCSATHYDPSLPIWMAGDASAWCWSHNFTRVS